MRVVLFLQRCRHLFMQTNLQQPNPSSASLKRPYGQQAHVLKGVAPSPKPDMASGSSPWSDTRPDNRNQRPKKAPKVDGVQSPAGPSSPHRAGHFGTRRVAEASRPTRGSPLAGRGGHKAASKRQAPAHPLLPEPSHDLHYIKATYKTKPLKAEWEINPKSPLSNYSIAVLGEQVAFDVAQYRTASGLVWRYALPIWYMDGVVQRSSQSDYHAQKRGGRWQWHNRLR